MSTKAQEAVVLGSEYIWDKEALLMSKARDLFTRGHVVDDLRIFGKDSLPNSAEMYVKQTNLRSVHEMADSSISMGDSSYAAEKGITHLDYLRQRQPTSTGHHLSRSLKYNDVHRFIGANIEHTRDDVFTLDQARWVDAVRF